MDLDPLITAHDLAIVTALLDELGSETKRSLRVKELVGKLERRNVDLCTAMSFYGYERLADDEEADD